MKLGNMTIEQIRKVAEVLFAATDDRGEPMFSREYPSVDAVAGVLIMGAGLDLTAYEALSGLWPRDGKLNLNANLMASRIKSHPRYTYRVRENSDERCTIDFIERQTGEVIGTTTYSFADAERAGLTEYYDRKSGRKSPQPAWTKFRRQMLFARALSEGYRTHCPDALAGAVYVESHGQLEAEGDGMLRTPPEPATVAPQRPVPPRAAEPEPPAEPARPEPTPPARTPEPEPATTPRIVSAPRTVADAAAELQRLVQRWTGCSPEDRVSMSRKCLEHASTYRSESGRKATLSQLVTTINWVRRNIDDGESVSAAFAKPPETQKQEHDDFASAL